VKSLRARLSRDNADAQAGFSLIEVMVAMMVFAIISVGVVFTLLSSFSLSNESRSREVAANLAAQEIDLDRSTSNIFNLLTAPPRTVQVPAGGITYTVNRTVSWVDNSGNDVNCGSESGTLQYKRIHFEVSWPGMIGSPVTVDTLLAPTSVLSADTLGTILVSAKNAAGAGDSGATITVSPSPGSSAPATDSNGCSYVLNVPPASYTVTASETNYLDPNQSALPSQTRTVVAGSSASAQFLLDLRATVAVTYATNYATLSPKIPTNLTATFEKSTGNYTTPATSVGSVYLYPTTYTAVAGSYLSAADVSGGCLSADPGSWLPGTNSAGKTIQSPPPITLPLTPGGAGSAALPMGVVTIKNTAGFSSNAYITAKTTTPVAGLGDPGCPNTMSYTFGQIMPKATNSTVTLALPYGTWSLQMGTAATPTTTVTTAQESVPTGVTIGTTVSAGGLVTLDPRQVTP
jgi:prepilin-type N-terminal cleavage/methylation domain-containing protein